VVHQIDQGCAALVTDLKARGLLEDTLVVWGGEFGRTPMGENRDKTGRNHHIDAFSMWFAGGGIKPGITLGKTDELGFSVTDDKAHVHDIHATILYLLGLDHSTVGYLRQLLDDWRDRELLRVDCFTFAFRDGLPHEADWVVDTRFLDSPYWITEMRERPGTDPQVREYVMDQPGAQELVGQFLPMLLRLVPLYQEQRRSVLRVAVGCTGGLHRSMAIASELVERIDQSGAAAARFLEEPPLHLPQELD